MMKKLVFIALAALTALNVWASEAPDALVKRVTEEVLEIVRQDKDLKNGDTHKAIELVDKMVLPHFNFQRMTALAVGRDWRRASPQQQQQLSQEFRTLLVRTYANAFTGYKNQKVVFRPFRMNPADTDALVRTEIQQPGGKPIQIDYNLERIDTQWKVYDVVVAGISLVTNYREQFGQEIRSGGIDGLIAAIAAKNKTLEASVAKK